MSADELMSAGNVASFRMQVSRTTRKVGPGASQALNTSESPAHRWRDPVQWTLRTHCNGQRRSLSAVASSGLVPSQRKAESSRVVDSRYQKV